MRLIRIASVVFLVVASLTTVTSTANGAIFVVTTTADANGACDQHCSLREAVLQANALTGADVIRVPAGFYDLTLTAAPDDDGDAGDLDITSEISITGAGPGKTVIRGRGTERVIHTLAAGTLNLTGVTITGGAQNNGAGVANSGRTTITNAEIVGNESAGSGGGVLSNGVSLTITSSTIHGNTAISGGGVYNDAGQLSIADSVVADNVADVGGGIWNDASAEMTRLTVRANEAANGAGGLANFPGGVATVDASTFSQNVATGVSGGIYNTDELTVTRSTISDNEAGQYGGGFYNAQGTDADATIRYSTIANNTSSLDGGGIAAGLEETLRLEASIVANNVDTNATPNATDDCAGIITSLGYNVFTTNDCLGLTGTGDTVADPVLGSLRSNGGPTETHSISSGGAANDRVPIASAGCDAAARDQRGLPRSQDGSCDPGAYELFQCRGFTVNVVGTDGSDVLEGTNVSDGIAALGGNDTVRGLGGEDRICGGTGNDRLFGDDHNDVLDGEKGRNDKCFGGAGSDTFFKCETKKQ